MERDDLAMDFK